MPVTPLNTFRLLVPTVDVSAPAIELAGKLWTMTDAVPLGDPVPEYICLSYSWGSGRATNPLAPDQWMSDRTIPVIETAIRALQPSAIWIDIFCVPTSEPERTACLRSLGLVYASASQVIAVLSEGCSAVFKEINDTGSLSEAGLLLLENDDWISRAWTYQEMVNSQTFYFVAEGDSSSQTGMQFLNAVGCALEDYRKCHSYDSFTLRAVHPRLDNLEDTIAAWLTAGYEERSAYQAMSSMDRRTSEIKDDYFNALIGAITAVVHRDYDETSLHPAEYFMRVCEEKGDFSFIYSSAPRSDVAGKSWRPLAGPLHAIQPWHTFGDGQSGSLQEGFLRLNNMCCMTRGRINSQAEQFLAKRAGEIPGAVDASNMSDRILLRLRAAGFAGSGEHIELEEGYFFPLTASAITADFPMFVAVGIRWAHGAPGLITTQRCEGLHFFQDVGVFVGPPPESGDSIDLA